MISWQQLQNFIREYPLVLPLGPLLALGIAAAIKEHMTESARQAETAVARLGLVLGWLCTGVAAAALAAGAGTAAFSNDPYALGLAGVLAGSAALIWLLGKALKFILAGSRIEEPEADDTLAVQVMQKWWETAQSAVQAVQSRTTQELVGRFDGFADFSFDYQGLSDPATVSVTVSGLGAYTGFWGMLSPDGTTAVGFEKRARPGAKQLVRAIMERYPQVKDGNKIGANVQAFVQRFATQKR